MTRDEIIAMAREAKLGAALSHGGQDERIYIEGADWHDELMRFVTLVAAAEREAIIDIVSFHGGSVEIEAAIRARGNP